MGEYSLYQIVGVAGVSLLVVAWLAASFAAPGKTQSRLAWIGACLLYVSLGTLFAYLFFSRESLVAKIAFGFLLTFFSAGFLVALVKTLGQFRSGRSSGEHATH